MELETYTFIDVVTKAIKISEFLGAMSAGGVSIGRVAKRIVQVLLIARNLMLFPEVAFVRASLSESSMTFMALENRDLSARVGVGLWDGDRCNGIIWDMDSSVLRFRRHGNSLEVRPAAG